MHNFFKKIIQFWGSIIAERNLVKQLSQNDFKVRYAGSYFGWIWAFVQPIVTILVFWFVFQVGFKTPPVGDVPYILWLISGIIPWFFFSDALTNGTNAFIEYNYLVKKVVFRISVLPVVKMLSSLYVHIFFVVFMYIIFIVYGYHPQLIHLQLIYYVFANIVLVMGAIFLSASIIPFFKDLNSIIAIFLQLGFWLTPIFWVLDNIPVNFQKYILVNPLYYVTQGYRESLVFNKWFWEKPEQTLYFWFFSLGLFICGFVVFKKMKPHFSDVL